MIKRHLGSIVSNSIKHFPVALLTGARQVGKSTLAKAMIGPAWPASYLTLDDRRILDAALEDPDGLLTANPPPLVLDEVQRAPDLMRAIKVKVDKDRRPGMYLLTGSANPLAMKTVSETLAGRMSIHQLLPFSWSEIERTKAPATLDTLFDAKDVADLTRSIPRAAIKDHAEAIKERIITGGYPPVAVLPHQAPRSDWFESYLQAYVERDILTISNIEHLPDFNRLIRIISSRTGRLINFSDLSRDISLPLATVRRYMNLLQVTWQIFLVYPYFTNIGKRMVKTPKLYFGDTGMACYLSGCDDWNVVERQDRAGALVETWVACELLKLITSASRRTQLYFWGLHQGSEVDFLIDRSEKILALEVKWSQQIGRETLKSFAECSAALKGRHHMSIILYPGREVIALDSRTAAVPFSIFFGIET